MLVRDLKLVLIPSVLILGAQLAAILAPAAQAEEQLDYYEHFRTSQLQATKSLDQFQAQTGFRNIKRNSSGNAIQGDIRVLVDNPGAKVSISTFGPNCPPTTTTLQPDPSDSHYFVATIPLCHKMEYRISENGKSLIDPSASLFASKPYEDKFNFNPPSDWHLNSVFWDFDRPVRASDGYQMRYDRTVKQPPDLTRKPVIIGEVEARSLAQNWAWQENGQVKHGPDFEADTYRFIAEKGIPAELRKEGYNAIEFVPFNQSAAGSDWFYRYQVYGLFAPDSRFGSPDEFAEMCDAFNKAGLTVIMDAVVGHFPYKPGTDRDLDQAGLQAWVKGDGRALYAGIESEWGTKRYDYANPYVRRFVIDSLLHMVKRYGIGGIRFDNFDGTKSLQNGWDFFQELVSDIRAYQPRTLLIGEIFFGDPANMKRHDQGGIGIDYRNDSDFFDFVKNNLLSEGNADIWSLNGVLTNPWGWTGELPRMKYVTTHDEAANGRGGATGKYVAALIKSGDNSAETWKWVQRKTRAFASLAMLSGSIYLDMPQMRLLQEGSFSDNPALQWELRDPFSGAHPEQKASWDYFATLSNYVQSNEAFSFQNLNPSQVAWIDPEHDVITLHRSGGNKEIYAVINMGTSDNSNYCVGVNTTFHPQAYDVKVDSSVGIDAPAGTSFNVQYGSGCMNQPDSVYIGHLAPFGVVVLEKR